MSRTYKTLSLSLPPNIVVQLEKRGKKDNKTAARIAAEIVIRDVNTSDVRTAHRREFLQDIAPLLGLPLDVTEVEFFEQLNRLRGSNMLAVRGFLLLALETLDGKHGREATGR